MHSLAQLYKIAVQNYLQVLNGLRWVWTYIKPGAVWIFTVSVKLAPLVYCALGSVGSLHKKSTQSLGDAVVLGLCAPD